MDAAVGFLSALFWGLLTLSVLVFIHEGGHFLAARACGVRVTEFFLGLPCSKNIHRVSKRIGTKFGVTPILLGGYAAVSGMEDAQTPCAAAVLSAVSRVHNHHRPLRRFRSCRGSQVEPHRLKHKKVHRRQKQHGAKAYGMLFFHRPHLQKRICAPTGGLSVLSIINASSLRCKPWRFLPVEMHRYSRRCIR